MRRLFTRRNIITGLLSVALIILFLGFYAYKNIRFAVGDTRKTDLNMQSLNLLDDVFDDLQEIEAGQRDYIISRDSFFLTPFVNGIQALHSDTVALRKITALYPERRSQYDTLLNLVGKRAQLSSVSVNFTKQGKIDDAVQIINSGTGSYLMDSIRNSITLLKLSDRNNLQELNKRRKTATNYSISLLLSLLFFSLTGLAWLGWRLLREEKTRRESDEQINYLAGLTEETSDAVFSTDRDGVILSWNKGAENIFGFSKQEALGRYAPELTRSSYTAEDFPAIAAAIAKGGDSSMESVAYSKDNKEITCQCSITELKNKQQEVTGYVMVVRDITALRINERLLGKFNEELTKQVEVKTSLVNSIVERIQDGFYSLNNDRVFTYVNEYAATVMESTPGELQGKHIWTLFPDALNSPAYDLIESAFNEQYTHQKEFFYEPYKKWFSLTAYPSLSGISVYFKDITEQKTAEEKIRRSSERFDLISRTTNDAVWEWDLETGELWGNEMHQQLYGLSVKDPVPPEQDWQERLHPDDRAAMMERQKEAIASGTNVFISEYRFRTEHNGYRNIYDRCYIVRDDDGKAIRLLGSMMDITERKNAEEANRNVLQLLKYSELVGKTGYWKWDLITNQVSWSEGTYRIFGESKEGFLGTLEDFSRRVDKNDVQHVSEAIRRAIENCQVSHYEFWIHTPGGEKKYLGTTAEPQQDDKGNIIMLFGTTIDLTERKTTEEKILKSEERYRELVENAVEALVVMDAEKGKFVNVSESAAGLFKMTKEELLMLGPADVSPEYQPDGRRSVDGAREKIQLAIEGGKPSFEWIHCDKNCQPITCEVRLVRLPSDTGVLIRGSIIDISERKKAEQAIIDSEETRRLIMNSALDAIVCADIQGVITVWTPQAEKIFGWKESEALGRKIDKTIIPERLRDAHHIGLEIYRTSGKGRILNRIMEIAAINKSGEEFPIELSVIPVKRGDTEFFCAFIRDITVRKNAEARLKESDEMIRQILSSSADDFYVIDENFRVTLINSTARKNLGLLSGREVETGCYILDIFPQDRKDFIRENYLRVLSGGTVEYEFQNEIEGKPSWKRVRYSPVKDAEERITGCFVSTTDITEKKKAEEDIIKINARFQMVSKATSDIVWDLDLVNDKRWWNDNYYANLGYTRKKVLYDRNDWYEKIHPEDQQRVMAGFAEAIAGADSAWRYEYRYRKADGSYINILDRGYIMHNNEGQPYRVIGSMVDMTPVYEQQKKLAESENRLRTILDTDPECIKLLDSDCNMIDINKAGLNMIEANSYEEVLGESLLTVVADEQREKAAEMVKAAFSGKKSLLEFEMITLKGTKRFCEVSIVPFRNAEKKIISALGVTRDITERKTAEIALAKNEEKYRTLVEQAHDAILLFDASGKLQDVNTGLTRMLGYTKKELLKMNLPDIFQKEELKSDPLRFDILKQDKARVKRIKVLRKDGMVVQTEIKSQQLPDGRFLSIIRDLTDRISAEKKLEESYQQLRELNGYLENVREEERSNIAREIHDELGQQLTVLKMDISWLKKKLADNPDNGIADRLNGLLEMINNTVRSVRRISAELRPSMLDDLGLPAAIEWHAQEFMNRSGIQIRTNINSREIKLGSKTAITLFRVFQESLTNVARHAEAGYANVILEQNGDQLVLTVEDNGKGFIPESIRDKKTLGILGMKERVAIIKGSYDIQSTPEKGTVVRVSVPVTES